MKNKTVFVSGNFNVFHPGHLRLLQFARGLGERLVVGVLSDVLGAEGVYVPETLRLGVLAAYNWIDEVLLIEDSVTATITRLKPDIVVKGKEYEGEENIEEAVLSEYGGTIVFASGEVRLSSLQLLRDFRGATPRISPIPFDYAE